MKIKSFIFLFAIYLLAFAPFCSAQSTQNTEVIKRGGFIIKGVITSNGKPLSDVNIKLLDLPNPNDLERTLSAKNGSYRVGAYVNNFYKKGVHGWLNIVKAGYCIKDIWVYLELPKGIKQATFTLELSLDLALESDSCYSTQCGRIVWSEEKNNFVFTFCESGKVNKDSSQHVLTPKIGEKVILKNIFFETNKSNLLPSSNGELNKLAAYLIKNKSTSIEISGHTDNTGNEDLNKQLSEARAKAVADYLILKGIDKTRVTYKGCGSKMPIVKNDTEEGRQQNRRVEFIINTK